MSIHFAIDVPLYCFQALLVEIFDKREDGSDDILILGPRRRRQARRRVRLALTLLLRCHLLHFGRRQDVLLGDLHSRGLLTLLIAHVGTVELEQVR